MVQGLDKHNIPKVFSGVRASVGFVIFLDNIWQYCVVWAEHIVLKPCKERVGRKGKSKQKQVNTKEN